MPSSAENIRFHQIRRADLSGGANAEELASTDTGTKTDGHIGKWEGGNIVDGVIPAADLVTTTGAGGTTQGLTSGGYGSWYGQVPRGAINGSNKTFLLDYKLVNPYAVLHQGEKGKLPSVQGDPANPLSTMAVPSADFSITNWTLTVTEAPQPGDDFYIYYFRADPLANVSTITAVVWTSHTSEDGNSYAFGEAAYVAPDATTTSIVSDGNLWSLRQDSATITIPTGSQISSFAGSSIVFNLNGSVFANAPNELNIYDAYLSVVLADSTSFTLRPSSWGFTSGSDQNIVSWKPNTGFGTGETILDGNGNLQLASVRGTSGSTSPAWSIGGTTTDGSVTWTYQGPGSTQTSSTGQIKDPTLAYDSDATPPTTFATFTRTHYSGLSTGGTFTVFFDGSAGAVPGSGGSSGGSTGGETSLGGGGFTVNGPAAVSVNGTAVSFNDTVSVNGVVL